MFIVYVAERFTPTRLDEVAS